MINNGLKNKISHSIELLQKYEKLAIELNPNGYNLAFSGGKDSQCIHELAKMAGVKFVAKYENTTIDEPQNVQFIMKNYKDVEIGIPKKNFYKLIEEKGLPTMRMRFCCHYFKEKRYNGFTILGIRAEESQKRAKYSEVNRFYTTKKIFYEEQLRAKDGLLEFENVINQSKRNKKFKINPIYSWTEADVFEFLDSRGIELNPCYDNVGRVGCIFCPYAPKRMIEYNEKRYNKHRALIIRSIDRYIQSGHYKNFKDAEEVFDWWKSKKSVKLYFAEKKQIKLF